MLIFVKVLTTQICLPRRKSINIKKLKQMVIFFSFYKMWTFILVLFSFYVLSFWRSSLSSVITGSSQLQPSPSKNWFSSKSTKKASILLLLIWWTLCALSLPSSPLENTLNIHCKFSNNCQLECHSLPSLGCSGLL